jgi:MFS family permease
MENKKAFTIIFLTVFIDLLGFGLVIPILPTYAKELGATNVQVGFLAGIFSAMNFFFTPFLGSYSDRIGRRPSSF